MTRRNPRGPAPLPKSHRNETLDRRGGNPGMESMVALMLVVGLTVGLWRLIEHLLLRHRLWSCFAAMRGERGGTISHTALLELPSLEFEHDGRQVRVAWRLADPASGRRALTVEAPWPDASLVCEVHRARFYTGPAGPHPFPDIQVGDPRFDQAFRIGGNDPPAIVGICGPEVRAALEQLWAHDDGSGIHLVIAHGTLRIQRRGGWHDRQSARGFIDGCLRVYDGAMSHYREGIEVLDTSVSLGREVQCQICGETCRSNVVFCRRCQTPHHRDCWEYNSGCSTFGCGEADYVTASHWQDPAP